MLGRYTKTLTTILILNVLCLVFALPAFSTYLCLETLADFDTLEECQTFCPGGNCIESGTYMCSADVDGDGETELYQCQQVYQCPLGDYPCDENHICTDGNYIYTTQTNSFECSFLVDTRSGGTVTFTGNGNCIEVSRNNTHYKACFSGATFSGSLTVYLNSRDPNRIHYYNNRFCFDSNCIYISGGIFDTNILNALIWAHPLYISVDEKGLYIQAWGCGTATYLKVKIANTAQCTLSWQCPIEGGSACEDVSISENYKDETPDLSYYQNDGEVDPATGQCLGQIYFFNGRPMLCRHAGLQTGFHNCCDADDEVVQELGNQLSLLGGTLAVISKLKNAISLATQTVELYNLLAPAAPYLEEISSIPGYSQTAVNAAFEAVKAGKTASDAAINAIVSGLGLTPTGIITQIALNFAMDFAMKILMGGCSEDDVITAAYNALGLCHFIGTKCVKKLPIIGCVQTANIYCCFNSKLARIIQEQGRPQLKTIDGWGSTDFPNCRGLTPQEFQNLDFSKIDLHEWQEDIKTQSQDLIQENLQKNFNTFVNNLK